MRVFVGYPSGGKVDSRFMDCSMDLWRWEAANPSPLYQLVDLRGSPPDIYVAENRNRLVRMAREARADWLLQVDPDETFIPQMLRVLMRTADAATRPILVGHYANVGNLDFDGNGGMTVLDMVYRETGDGQYQGISVPENMQPFEVDAFGAGVMLTHLRVFDDLEYPWFETAYIQPTGKTELQFMNEDLAFARKVREAGYRIWCDPLAEATHWKVIPLKPSTTRTFLEAAMRDTPR
jgi:GT2 family glycosyltransferase